MPTNPARKKPTPERLFEVGVIQAAHGLKGALTVHSHTRPASGIAGYSFWYLGNSPQSAGKVEVRRCWQHKRALLAEIEGVADRNAAEALKGKRIYVPESAVERADDEFLWQDLTGCRVEADDGRLLGTVTGLQAYGAQDILIVVAPDDAAVRGEWMLPFVDEVILDVDLDGRRIAVHLPEGIDACFTPSS